MHAFLLYVSFSTFFVEIILGAEEHAYQQFIECSFNTEGQVDHLWNYGYDGKDLMHIDLVKKAVVATSQPGQRLAEERQSTEYIRRKEDRLKMVCSAVKTVFLMSNNTLSKPAKPAVLLSSGGKKDEEYLKCAVHGFYPNVIQVRWTRAGRPIYYGVSTTGILPHRDGRFQMTSYLSLGNISDHAITCEIEHLSISGKMRITYGLSCSSRTQKKIFSKALVTDTHFIVWTQEKKSLFLSAFTEHVGALVVVFLLGFVLSAVLTLLVSWMCQHKRNPPKDDIQNTSADSETSMNLMNIPQET